MMQKIWKNLLAAGCAASLLATAPGIPVLADQLQEDEVIVTEAEDPELVAEPAEEVQVDAIDEENSNSMSEEDNQFEENIPSDTVDKDYSANEGLVGEGDLVVGDGVTATFDEKNGVVEFYSNGGTLWTDWQEQSGLDTVSVSSIRVASGKVYLPEDSSRIFSVRYCKSYYDEYEDYEDVDYSYTLERIDLSRFDTSKVLNMEYMFADCENLTSLDLSSFDTSNVTNMSGLFHGCRSLKTLNLCNFNTANVSSMCEMFYFCSSLENLDLSSFYTSKVTDMKGMFVWCQSLTNLDLSGFDTSNVKDMSYLFEECSSLRDLSLNGINTSNVIDMKYMFSGCHELSHLDLDGFDTSSVIDMQGMFSYCKSLTDLDLGGFNTLNVTNMEGMFGDCEGLAHLNLQSFDTSNVISMYRMFISCSSLRELDLSSFDTSNVTNMTKMFCDCVSLTELDLSKFNTSNVNDMEWMFLDCSNLEKLDLSCFDTSNVEYMSKMFSGCESLKNLDLNSFKTQNVKAMNLMFYGCSSLTSLDLSNFNTSNVIDMNVMFGGCKSMVKLDVSNFDTSHVWGIASMFSGCTSLTELDLSSFNTSSVDTAWFGEDGDGIFKDCKNLLMLRSPKINSIAIKLPITMYDELGNEYTELPVLSNSITLTNENPAASGDINNCSVTLSTLNYMYDGKAKKPVVTVKDGNNTLTQENDYKVIYVDNTNAGTATVKVEGIGKYKGAQYVTFTIEKAAPKLNFASSSVNKTTLDAAFTNKLTKTTDGTVTFKSSNTKVATVNSTSGKVTIKGVGSATITATVGEGTNYKSGRAKYTLTVVDGRTDVSGLTISLSATSYTYDGKAKEPAVTVKNGDTTLISGTDYTVSYSDNTNAGTAMAKVIGAGKYKGEKSVTFTINKAEAKLAFAENSVAKTTTDEAFTNTLTKTTDGTVTFKSGNAKVATVDSASGLVTIKGAGTATITASSTEGKNYKAGSASYILTAEAPPTPTPTPTPTISGFSDVQDPSHAFYKAIYWAADAGITKGYPDGTFGIDRSCSRGEMIMFLWRYAGKPAPKALSKSPFKDVPKTHAFYSAIIWASQKGITKGYPDGTFGINRNVSRGECMMFLWRLRGKPAPKAVSVSPFKDVPKTHAFYNAILWGAQKKITNGYTSGPKKGTFGINENCTRGAIVTFLYRAR